MWEGRMGWRLKGVLVVACLLILPPCLAGCYAGLAGVALGIVSATDEDSSGASPDRPRVTDLRLVANPAVGRATELSHVEVVFRLVETTSEPAQVTVEFSRDGFASDARPATLEGETRSLGTSSAGIAHTLVWNAELDGLRGFQVVSLRVVPHDGDGEGTAKELLDVEVGNDPPEIVGMPAVRLEVGRDEVVGIANLGLTVRDSSNDQISVRVEYNLAPYTAGWEKIRPAGGSDRTPEFAIAGVRPSNEPLELFWNVVGDLGRTEADVKLRFRAWDGVDWGIEEIYSPVFRVDNNDPPVIRLDARSFVANPDRNRGIPVPFEVSDAEGKEVQVVLQWSPVGVPFADLPDGIEGIKAVLADPGERRRLRVASERITTVAGRVAPPVSEEAPGGRTVRLPELASAAATILRHGLTGLRLEILRPPERYETAVEGADLRAPVAALPLADGRTALVLERLEGSWRLRELELGSGRELRAVAGGSAGRPSAMSFERGRRSVLLALDTDGDWRIERLSIDGSDGDEGERPTLLVRADASVDRGTVRAIASLGRDAALITVGSSLLRLDYREPGAGRAAAVLEGLEGPWGLALDPLLPEVVYLAERDWKREGRVEGRVLRIELDTLTRADVVTGERPFLRPEALALERSGARLLAVTAAEPTGGTRRLMALDLRRGGEEVYELSPNSENLPGEIGSLAVGPDGLRLIASTSRDSLLVAGGLEQARTITAHEPATQEVTVDDAFDPPLSAGRPWRLARPSALRVLPAPPLPETRREVFLWDAGDVPAGGEVVLRALAYDSEQGFPSDSELPRRVNSLFADPEFLGERPEATNPVGVRLADLDQDGDLDIVLPARALAVYRQESPGSFRREPSDALDPAAFHLSAAVADLDGDGDLDIASTRPFVQDIAVYHQKDDGSFGPAHPLSMLVISVVAADLDSDGDQDLVAASPALSCVELLFQSPDGFPEKHGCDAGDPVTTRSLFHVAVADLDADGKLDLVTANRLAPSLTVFYRKHENFAALENGGSGFSSLPDVTLEIPAPRGGPFHVAAADLSGDGHLDLVSANGEANQVTVFFQEGPGTFSDPLTLGGAGLTDGVRYVGVADVNGDGAFDLVSANAWSDNLTVFVQRIPGEFSPAPDFVLGGLAQGTDDPRAVALADLDGDGRLDVVSANNRSGNLALFFQRRPGDFSSAPRILGDSTLTRKPSAVAWGDLDGDGDLDLASANESGELRVFLQTSPGEFSRTEGLGSPELTPRPTALAVADLDGDGDLDIAAADRGGESPNVTVFFQRGAEEPGEFAFPAEPDRVLAAPGAPVAVAAGDLSGDGLFDLVTANPRSDSLSVFLQEPGGGSFRPAPGGALEAPGQVRGPVDVALADLDGDGDLDLVSANEESANLTIFFQVEPGKFSLLDPQSVLPVSGSPSAVLAADLDGDGDADILSASGGSDQVMVHFQRAPGVFVADPGGPLGDSASTARPSAVAAGDLDGDGDTDIVAAGERSDTLAVFLQKRPGEYDRQPDWILRDDQLLGPRSLAVADLDGDGEIDIVSANFDSDTLAVFFGGH